MTTSRYGSDMLGIPLLQRGNGEADDLLHSPPFHLVHSAPDETTA